MTETMLKKLSKKTKFMLIISCVYFFSPIDLIPDYIPGIGEIDDLAVIAYTFKCVLNDLKAVKELKRLKVN